MRVKISDEANLCFIYEFILLNKPKVPIISNEAMIMENKKLL